MPNSAKFALAGGVLALTAMGPLAALEVTIQDATLTPSQGPGDLCVDLTGEYPGVRVEPSEAGKVPQICYDTINRNLLTLRDATFVATNSEGGPVSIRFSHDFPAGPSGLIYARTRLVGFFANADGTAAPTDAGFAFHGFWGQAGNDDLIGDALEFTVGDDLETDRYLGAGRRVLSGALDFQFVAGGDTVTVEPGSGIDIEPARRVQEKFEDISDEF
jgi:hypothetical protein